MWCNFGHEVVTLGSKWSGVGGWQVAALVREGKVLLPGMHEGYLNKLDTPEPTPHLSASVRHPLSPLDAFLQFSSCMSILSFPPTPHGHPELI